jgi:hypothetical protein
MNYMRNINTSNRGDAPDDYNSDTPMVVDVRTTNDVKFYFISLALTILTMIICKVVWFTFKNISWKFVESVDDINAWILYKRSQKNNVSNRLTFPPAGTIHESRSLKIRRSISSNTSLKSISLSNEDSKIGRSDSSYSNIERGGSADNVSKSRTPSPPSKLVGIIIMKNQ